MPTLASYKVTTIERKVQGKRNKAFRRGKKKKQKVKGRIRSNKRKFMRGMY